MIECIGTRAREQKQNTEWRSRLVGRGRTIGNRVTGKTVREFESLLLRQKPLVKTSGFSFGNPIILHPQKDKSPHIEKIYEDFFIA